VLAGTAVGRGAETKTRRLLSHPFAIASGLPESAQEDLAAAILHEIEAEDRFDAALEERRSAGAKAGRAAGSRTRTLGIARAATGSSAPPGLVHALDQRGLRAHAELREDRLQMIADRVLANVEVSRDRRNARGLREHREHFALARRERRESGIRLPGGVGRGAEVGPQTERL
jgi:hypothetical protein